MESRFTVITRKISGPETDRILFHDRVELMLVRVGQGSLFLDGELLPLGRGSFALIPPGALHFAVPLPKEELELACIARSTLVRSKVLTPEEKAVIREKDPVVKIVYSSNRTGDATISWQLPKRWVAVFIRGTFFTPSAQWMMKIRDNQPEWLDLRGQKPATGKKK